MKKNLFIIMIPLLIIIILVILSFVFPDATKGFIHYDDNTSSFKINNQGYIWILDDNENK
ncbi:hypothetical protein KJ877_06475 [bacterium]|nr:hypothetical protein [bacterium]MBU1990707.1 hypothetical protein [bacterium]